MILIINPTLRLICHQLLIMVLRCSLVSPNNLLYLTLVSDYIVMLYLYIKGQRKCLNKQCYNIRT